MGSHRLRCSVSWKRSALPKGFPLLVVMVVVGVVTVGMIGILPSIIETPPLTVIPRVLVAVRVVVVVGAVRAVPPTPETPLPVTCAKEAGAWVVLLRGRSMVVRGFAGRMAA